MTNHGIVFIMKGKKVLKMGDTENKKDGIDAADQSGVGENTNTSGDANAQNDTGSGNEGSGSSNSSSEKTFTQKQVSSMMAKEKKQGREAAFKEMGLDPTDSKMVSMFKAFIESQKTDEQKATEEAAANAAKIAEAEQRAMIAEAKAEAMQLGILPQYVDDAVSLAVTKMNDDTDLKTIIGEFKTKYSIWFENSNAGADGKNATGQKGTGASINNSSDKNGGNEKRGMGARLAAQRKTSTGKKSFWS